MLFLRESSYGLCPCESRTLYFFPGYWDYNLVRTTAPLLLPVTFCLFPKALFTHFRRTLSTRYYVDYCVHWYKKRDFPSWWKTKQLSHFLKAKTSFLSRNSLEIDVQEMWILSNIRLWKCEFCQSWDFKNVNFVKYEIFKMWILSKMRLWKWDFQSVNFCPSVRLPKKSHFCAKMRFLSNFQTSWIWQFTITRVKIILLWSVRPRKLRVIVEWIWVFFNTEAY